MVSAHPPAAGLRCGGVEMEPGAPLGTLGECV